MIKSRLTNNLPIFLVFICGYCVASYQLARYQIEDEINDYQREILIAIRLLEAYSESSTLMNKEISFPMLSAQHQGMNFWLCSILLLSLILIFATGLYYMLSSDL